VTTSFAKYSAWASACEPPEKAKPVGATEFLLSNDGGWTFGRFDSNIFVVATNHGVEVQTTTLGDGVFSGVIC